MSTIALLIIAFVLAAFAPAAAQEDGLGMARLVHASADAPAIDVQVDGITLTEGLTFGQATPYYVLEAGEHTFTLSAGDAPVLEQTLTLEADQSVTVLAAGAADEISLKTTRDDRTPVELGTGRVTVVNAAQDLDAVDLQTTDGATLVSGVGQGKASPAVELPVDVYDLQLVVTDGDGDPLPGSSTLEVHTNTLYTIILLDGGSLTLTASTEAAESDAEPARLRLAHASANAPRMDLYLNDVKAFTGLGFGNATESIALPAGDYAVALYPSDADPATTSPLGGALTLNPGEARVLVVMGSSSEVQLVAFGEDITPPSAGTARVNFIHAVPDAPAVNLVLDDDTVLIENLAFGSQSVGMEMSPARYEVRMTDATSGQDLLQLSRTELMAGRAYTTVVVPPSQGTQIVIPLTFSMPLAPVTEAAGPAVAAQPAEEPVEPAAEATEEPVEPAEPAAEATAEPTAEPTEAPAVAAEITGTVVTDAGYYLNVRNQPSLSESPQPIPGLPSGAEVVVQGRDTSGEWLFINWNPPGETPVRGWVSALYIEVYVDGEPVLYYTDLPLAFGDNTSSAAPAAAPADDEDEDTGEEEVVVVGEAAPSAGLGAATFTISDFHYTADGSMAQMWVNVTNHSMTPALASGNWYPTLNPDGGQQWVTLLKSGFLDGSNIPYPYAGDAPLWEFRVFTDDGLVFSAYAGCEYYNTIVGQGFEPTATGGFTWEQVLEGGWWSCGGDWGAGNVKPDHDLLPGESASVPLNIWLTNPHMAPGDPNFQTRRITRLDFIPKLPDNTSFGALDTQIPPE
jgi:hypothetical protein